MYDEDALLARQVAAGERAAFDRFFERYADRIHALALRRGADRGAAETCTRQVLTRALAELPHFRGEIPLDAWMLRHARALVGPPTPAHAAVVVAAEASAS
jgi:DNA-directed RNA polymerase specialized sigma24 family protein